MRFRDKDIFMGCTVGDKLKIFKGKGGENYQQSRYAADI